MKKVISSLIIAFTLLVSAQAFADPSAQSMAAIKAQDWQRAENSLSQDLKTDRKDALSWYFRAQVLNHLQRPDDALKCLDNVVKLDPNFRKEQVQNLRQRLSANSNIVANSKATGQKIVTSSSLERKQVESYNRTPSVSTNNDTVVSKPVSPTTVASNTRNDSNSGGAFFGFMIVIFIIGGLGFLAYMFISKRSTNNAIQKFTKETLAKLVDANTSLNEKRDFLEISGHDSTYLFKRIQSVLSDIDSHTRKLKDGQSNHDGYAIERTLDEVRDIEYRYKIKDYDAPVVQSRSEPIVQKRVEPVTRYESTPSQKRTENVHQQHERSHNNGHTTVINNGGNNGSDLLNTVATTILINDIVNSGRHHDTVRETPAYQDNNKNDDFDVGTIFGGGSSSSSYQDSSKDDDFNISSDDFDTSSSSDSSYQDSSSDDDFKL